MSLFDSPEEILQTAEIQICDKKSWTKFHNKEIEPRLKKIIAKQQMRNFAVGVYVPTEPAFSYNVAEVLESLCNALNVDFCHIDCKNIHSLHLANAYSEEIRSIPYSVVLIKDFDKVADEPLRKYIKYALIHLWESSNKLTRSNYFVIFTSSEGDGEQIPASLKKINGLKWYGNIRK